MTVTGRDGAEREGRGGGRAEAVAAPRRWLRRGGGRGGTPPSSAALSSPASPPPILPPRGFPRASRPPPQDALEAQGLFNEAAELLAARMELLHQEAHEQKQPVKPPPVSRWHLVSPRTVASLVTPRSRAAKANPEPELGPPAGAGGGPLAEVTATVIAQCSDGAHTTAGGALTARGQPTTADSEDPRRHSAPAEDLRGTMGPPTMEWLKAGLGNLY